MKITLYDYIYKIIITPNSRGITEMAEKSKPIYYAHSIKIYGTRREAREIRFLKKNFNNIFNPKTKINWDPLTKMQPYLRAVNNSSLIVASEYKKFIGKGVFEEIKFALDNNIPALCLKRRSLKFKLVKIKNVKYIGIDWKIYYGKIIVTL